MKKIFVCFAVLTAMFLMLGCQNKSQANSESQTDNESKVTKEAKIELEWSTVSDRKMKWNQAVRYCKNLNEGGYSDWRLPNIDELRTLIQNHPGTQSGGLCPISEKAGKLSGRDWTGYCDGRYGSNFSKLGDTGWFWSSSTRSEDSSDAWLVDFVSGYVVGNLKSDDGNVRCVRGNLTTSKNSSATSYQTETKAKKESAGITKIGDLTWSNKMPRSMDWSDAVNYCENLNEGGYTDWRYLATSLARFTSRAFIDSFAIVDYV